ncbi:MAG: SAM-dependent methyltransferase [Bacteroidota bacterium]
MRPVLYLIPVTLGDNEPEAVLPKTVKTIADSLTVFIVENVRTARRFLIKLGITTPIDDLTFFELNKHTLASEISKFLDPMKEGKSIGVMSEAGVPGVADPGAQVVRLAHLQGYVVQPLVGPSSILMALMASGMNGQSFTFHGYLPINPNQRVHTLHQLEKLSKNHNQAQIFMETPYRNQKLLEDIFKACQPDTMLCIAVDITLETEKIVTKPIGQWKKSKPDIHKRPAVFVLQRG